MSTDLIFDIVNLAVSVAKSQASGKVQQDATIVGAVVQIIQKSAQVYEDQTGKPLDPSLIKAEPPI